MLQCIVCSKQQLKDVDEDDAARGSPATKDACKSLTSQIKDMVLKFSGANRQCKPMGGSSSSSSYRRSLHHRPYSYDDMGRGLGCGGGGFHRNYDPSHSIRVCNSNSTPAWDFSRIGTQAEAGIATVSVTRAETFDSRPVTVMDQDEESKEWVAHVEAGVHITFIALPRGGNDLKRIRFSREMFDRWQAQRWWGENYDRITELYNVQKFNRQALTSPPRSEDERELPYSRAGSTKESPITKADCNNSGRAPSASSSNAVILPTTTPAPDPTEHFSRHYRHNHQPGAAVHASGNGGFGRGETSSMDASRTTTSSRGETASVSLSNASDAELTEWVAQDEPGVFITVRQLADGTRELRRVRFSRERFGEVRAKLWWEENRERIHAQYL